MKNYIKKIISNISNGVEYLKKDGKSDLIAPFCGFWG
jgi:hypothetical protein